MVVFSRAPVANSHHKISICDYLCERLLQGPLVHIQDFPRALVAKSHSKISMCERLLGDLHPVMRNFPHDVYLA